MDEHNVRIWSAAKAAYVTPADVFAAARDADYVLLGEKHDNPLHHRLQAAVIDHLAPGARAVAFEMLPEDLQGRVDAYFTAGGDAARFGEAVSWSALHWPAYAIYAPVVTATVAKGYAVKAADIPRPLLADVRARGVAAVDPAWADEVGLTAPLPATAQADLEATIVKSHCGHVPPGMLSKLVFVQRLRDARLAWNLSRASQGVLIAGAGHAHENAAPFYLERLRPGAKVIKIAFVEGAPESLRDVEGFDYLWPTETVDSEDPCEKYRESLERMKAR